ncbi:hypothetical protein Agub_g12401, partial [Astrephomene gubernaculifera]
PQQQQPEGLAPHARLQEQQGLAACPTRTVEVWWSWDPIFLFKQLGWQQQQQQQQGQEQQRKPHRQQQVSLAGSCEAAGIAEEYQEGAQQLARPASKQHADVSCLGNGFGGGTSALAPEFGDTAAQTAAEARAAFATEEEAVQAAGAAVAAAAEAAAAAWRLSAGTPEEGAEAEAALAGVQAANRAVVELYFHTYNTGRYKVLDHIVHPEYQYDGLLDLGDRRGRTAMEAMMGGWRDSLPDLAIGHE